MRHENSRQLFLYWNILRGDRTAPERSEIEPSDIRSILGDTFILEVSTSLRTISYRLAGTRLCAAHGRELKGLGYLALWSEEDNFEIARAVNQVYSKNTPMLLSYVARTESGRFVEFESILLPLATAADGNQRVLGIAAPLKTPFWLGAEPVNQLTLRACRAVDAESRFTGDTPALETDVDMEEPLASDFGPSTNRQYGHLTLLDGGLS